MLKLIPIAMLLLFQLGMVVQTEDPTPSQGPGMPDPTLDQLRFDVPTRVEGRFLLTDTYDEAIWLELTKVRAEQRWLLVPHTVQLLLYARDPSMMELFRKLPRGTALRLTIQTDQEGKRWIVELEGT
jgi:hypothetical protein